MDDPLEVVEDAIADHQDSSEPPKLLSDHPEHAKSNNESSSDGMEGLLQGTAYSLHSKRLKSKNIQRIAGALGLSTGASAAQTRKLIEKKLKETGCQPSQVQVIV